MFVLFLKEHWTWYDPQWRSGWVWLIKFDNSQTFPKPPTLPFLINTTCTTQNKVEHRVKTEPNRPKPNQTKNRFCRRHELRTEPKWLGLARFCFGLFRLVCFIWFMCVCLRFGSNRTKTGTETEPIQRWSVQFQSDWFDSIRFFGSVWFSVCFASLN